MQTKKLLFLNTLINSYPRMLYNYQTSLAQKQILGKILSGLWLTWH